MQMTRKKFKWGMAAVGAYLMYTVASLSWEAKYSVLNEVAVNYIYESDQLVEELGALKYSLLIGNRNSSMTSDNAHHVRGTLSCSNRSYFVQGTKGSKFLVVSLRQDTRDSRGWELLGITGWWDENPTCRPS